MRTSSIIPVWNGREYLPACLDAILAQVSPEDEVIVVDNGSTDGSVALVRERYPQVRLIENGRNLGFAGGCNVGLRAAQGDVLFILNQDVVLRNGWLTVMCEALAERTVGVAGCKLLYPDGTIQHAGGVIRWPQAMPDHWGHDEPDDGRWDEPRDVDYVTGAAWGFRRDTLEQVGELDEGFWPGYFEEVDYCFRTREMGQRVVYIPAAVAIHAESTTLGKGSRAYLRAFHRGRLRFVLKRLSAEGFLLDFAPAERAWLSRVPVWNRLVLAQVYRSALLMMPGIYAAREERSQPAFDSFQEVTEALVGLGAGAWQRSGGELGGEPLSEELIADLEARQTIREQPFRSDKPIVGPLIAWFRTVWNSVSARWYVLPLMQQQNEFNEAVVSHLREMDERLIELDRDQTALTRNVAELSYQLVRLNRQLGSIEALLQSRAMDSGED